MEKLILARYGEIHLKGQNRPYFESMLRRNLSSAVKEYGGQVEFKETRYYIRGVAEERFEEAVAAATRVFGIHSVSPAYATDRELSSIHQLAVTLMEQEAAGRALSFKVESKRGDKRFPLNSMELSAEVGGALLSALPNLTVDVHTPQKKLYIEIREEAMLYTKILPGAGGMPVGVSGRGMLLLSGGIDSPVAGYRMARRGMEVEAVHYHSFPYTSEQAKDKVIRLAKLMSAYTGPIRLHMVSFTDIQMGIYEKCPEEQLTILMRVFMMKIAARIAQGAEAGALITGESLAQVASQTLQSLAVTDAAAGMLVLRPLIGMDKDEIIDTARKIGTFETSIEPFEDCCTLFVPKHPATRPKKEKIALSMKLLDEEALIAAAVAGKETITVG